MNPGRVCGVPYYAPCGNPDHDHEGRTARVPPSDEQIKEALEYIDEVAALRFDYENIAGDDAIEELQRLTREAREFIDALTVPVLEQKPLPRWAVNWTFGGTWYVHGRDESEAREVFDAANHVEILKDSVGSLAFDQLDVIGVEREQA